MSQEIERVPPVMAAEFFGDEREAFDRLDNEHKVEHEWAMHYFRSGPSSRSYKEVAGYFEISRDRVQRTAGKHDWVQRAREFDIYQAERQVAEIQSDGQLAALRTKHMAKLNRLGELIDETFEHFNPERVMPRDLPGLLDMYFKFQRLTAGLGDAPKKIEITGKDGNPIEVVSTLTAAERREHLAAIAEATITRLKKLDELDVVDADVVEDEPDAAL